MRRPGMAYKWELVIMLWVALFLNQGDRQIYNVVIPLIREDLQVTDVQLGLVATIFTLVYAILVPFAGYAGDILRRKWVVFFSLVIFSVGTVFTGVSNGILLLILFRSITTAGGEAFYFPSANSLLGQFHQKTRAMAMSIHQTALYFGIICSGFVAGYIGERFGWRNTFYFFGVLGILWAVYVGFRMKDTPVISKEGKAQADRVPVREVLSHIFSKPTVWLLGIAFGTFQFVALGYLTWMPTYLHEDFSLLLSNAGFSSMFYHHVFAFAGVLLGGRISDHFARKRKKSRMATECLGLLLGAPFIFLLGHTDSLVTCYVAMGFFGLFRGVYDSNLFAALFDFIEPRYRSSSVGIMLAFAFAFSSLAPVLLGWIKGSYGLSMGLSSLSLFYVTGGLIILVAVRFFFRRDYVEETPVNNE